MKKILLSLALLITLQPNYSKANECNKTLSFSPIANPDVIAYMSLNKYTKEFLLDSITERLVKKRVYPSSYIGKLRPRYQIDEAKYTLFMLSNNQWVFMFNLSTGESSFREID